MSDEFDLDKLDDEQIESKARAQGWKPEDEYQGDPKRWRPAKEYLRIADNNLPLLRSQVRDLTAKVEQGNKTVEELRADLKASRQTFKEFNEFHEQTAEREYSRAMKQIKADMKQAVKDSDEEAAERLDKERDELEKEHRERLAKKSEETKGKTNGTGDGGGDGELPAEVATWMKDNPWYEDEPDMSIYADKVSVKVQKDGFTGQAYLDELRKRVEQRFPEYFGKGRTGPPGPEGGGGLGGEGRGGDKQNFESLPADAKAAYARFREEIGPSFTKEKYVRDYYGA